METRSSQTRVVVVGAGMAGLTAACYLARAGVDVTVIERASYLGGRAATQDFDGFRFNRGGHALYTGGAASRVLEELGVSYDYGIPKRTFVMQGGKLSPFPADPLGILRADLLNAGDKLALVRLLVAVGAANPQAVANTSVQGWLDQNVRRPQLRRLMTALARTFVYSTALDLVSADLFVEKLQRALRHPVHYVHGGWGTLVDGLRVAAERAGARMVSDVQVEGIEIGDGHARSVRLRDGSVVRASAVVVATSPRRREACGWGRAPRHAPDRGRPAPGAHRLPRRCLEPSVGSGPSDSTRPRRSAVHERPVRLLARCPRRSCPDYLLQAARSAASRGPARGRA
jgi:phytoene dehydrogenase-like protein